MTYKHRVMVYGRRHIHNHVRTLAEWQAKRTPGRTISEEYDRLLIAGMKALYNQDLQLDPPVKEPEPAPAPAVEAHG